MLGYLSLTMAITLINFDAGKRECSEQKVAYAKGENLWCYDCNTDLRDHHTTECNDPYLPAAYFYLVACPKNGSYHCLKSVIAYRDILVTVRGCVPSHEIESYCQQEKYFPEASITCSFCNDYACNGQQSFRSFEFFVLFSFILLYFKLLLF